MALAHYGEQLIGFDYWERENLFPSEVFFIFQGLKMRNYFIATFRRLNFFQTPAFCQSNPILNAKISAFTLPKKFTMLLAFSYFQI